MGELADRLQHAKAWLWTALSQQTLIDQLFQCVEHLNLRQGSVDRLNLLQFETAIEGSETPKQHLLGWTKQVVTPGDGAAKCLLAGGSITGPLREQGERVAEALDDGIDAQQPNSRRRQFDRQRQSVEGRNDRFDSRGVRIIERRTRG